MPAGCAWRRDWGERAPAYPPAGDRVALESKSAQYRHDVLWRRKPATRVVIGVGWRAPVTLVEHHQSLCEGSLPSSSSLINRAGRIVPSVDLIIRVRRGQNSGPLRRVRR